MVVLNAPEPVHDQLITGTPELAEASTGSTVRP